MKRAGQIALIRFPHTDQAEGKLRPVLLLRKASSRFDDWLVCMVSSQLQRAEPDLDESILPEDADFGPSGLKGPSVLRLGRLVVSDGVRLQGAIGEISASGLAAIRQRLARWIAEETTA